MNSYTAGQPCGRFNNMPGSNSLIGLLSNDFTQLRRVNYVEPAETPPLTALPSGDLRNSKKTVLNGTESTPHQLGDTIRVSQLEIKR
ncbi:hypothetical protein EVAR_86365_1 [Eumeta japonica]|uniref:Uncharacterized protein n=1 Tax=Eumeta variegata TaxID=151549 RepID=A0A4C1YHM3_EUMVA|nr:hypothetical protein EVAR_86365_1 [Eumeta japonica]